MSLEELNPLEKKVFEHWRLKITRSYSENLDQFNKEVDQIRNNLQQRGILTSGVAIGTFVDTYKQYLDKILKEFKEITVKTVLEWKLKSSSSFKNKIQSEIEKYFNPETLEKGFINKFSPPGTTPDHVSLLPLKLFINQVDSILKEAFLEVESQIPNKMEVFISSAQKEYEPERQRLKYKIEKHPVLGRFFDVFIFEKDGAPHEASPPEVYLEAASSCSIYIGIFGEELRGPVREEFEAAKNNKRYIFFDKNKTPNEELKKFRDSIKSQVSFYEFSDFEDLKNQIAKTLEELLSKG